MNETKFGKIIAIDIRDMIFCVSCNIYLRNRVKARSHFQTKHGGSIKLKHYECMLCGYRCYKARGISYHLYKKHHVIAKKGETYKRI